MSSADWPAELEAAQRTKLQKQQEETVHVEMANRQAR